VKEAGVTTIQVAVLDMAGTTVADDGLVEKAFESAAETTGVPADQRMIDYVRSTMGESKISVMRALFADESQAQAANKAFEEAYDGLIDAGFCAPIPGAAEAINRLREAGIKVALTTGFSRSTQDRILDALGWREIADLTLCPAEAGRGRPFPDLNLIAALRLAIEDVRRMATAGDTTYDMVAGARSGAGIVAGVRTGAHDERRLKDAGATDVLDSITNLPELLL